MAYDPALSASVEEIKLDDPHLSGVWGERIYRILLRAATALRQGKGSMRISQA